MRARCCSSAADPDVQRYRLADNGLRLPNQSAPDWARVHAALQLPVMTPAEAKRCAPGTTVKVRGVVHAGDAGELDAPISGQHCAWYRSYVQPGNWVLRPLPPEGRFSDIMLVAQPSRVLWRRYDQTDEISEQEFVVVGPDGAALRIDPRVADVNSDRVARNRVESSRFGFLHQLLVEFVLPVGAEVVLLAEIGPDHELTTAADGFVFVSTRVEAQLADRAAHGIATQGLTRSAFGFVRGGNRIARGIARFDRIMLVLAAVVVAVLLIGVLIGH